MRILLVAVVKLGQIASYGFPELIDVDDNLVAVQSFQCPNDGICYWMMIVAAKGNGSSKVYCRK